MKEKNTPQSFDTDDDNEDIYDSMSSMRVVMAPTVRKLVDIINNKGIIRDDIVAIKRFDEQFYAFYYRYSD